IYLFFSSRRRHTRSKRDWSSDVCSSDLEQHPDPYCHANATQNPRRNGQAQTPDHPGQTTRQENPSPYAQAPPLSCVQSALTTLTNLQPTDNLILIQPMNTTINHNRTTAREVLLSQRIHRSTLRISQHRLRLTRLINRQRPRIMPTALIVQERLHKAAIGVTARPVPALTKRPVSSLRVVDRREHIRERVPNVVRSPRIPVCPERRPNNLH